MVGPKKSRIVTESKSCGSVESELGAIRNYRSSISKEMPA